MPAHIIHQIQGSEELQRWILQIILSYVEQTRDSLDIKGEEKAFHLEWIEGGVDIVDSASNTHVTKQTLQWI